jgi:hypothetical protein
VRQTALSDREAVRGAGPKGRCDRQTALLDREAVRGAGPKGRCDRGSRTAHEADERASKADSGPGDSNAPEGERGRSTGTPGSGGAELNEGEGFGDTDNSGEPTTGPRSLGRAAATATTLPTPTGPPEGREADTPLLASEFLLLGWRIIGIATGARGFWEGGAEGAGSDTGCDWAEAAVEAALPEGGFEAAARSVARRAAANAASLRCGDRAASPDATASAANASPMRVRRRAACSWPVTSGLNHAVRYAKGRSERMLASSSLKAGAETGRARPHREH